jgi:hypothetical protein
MNDISCENYNSPFSCSSCALSDIFYFIKHCDLYNYADDNTLSFHSSNFDEVVNVLQQESNILINWFNFNCMQANPEKFQAIAVGKKSFAYIQCNHYTSVMLVTHIRLSV